MTNKIRFLIATLGLIAAVSAYQIFDSIQSRAFVRSLINSGSQSATADETFDIDVDKDGLTNGEESFWNTDFQDADSDDDGFKDGEEVASGHDPTVPGPDDKLDLTVGGNVSEKISGLIVAGLAQGSLRPDSPAFNTLLDQISDEAIFRAELNAPAVEEPKFKTVESSSQNIERYTRFIRQFVEHSGQSNVGILLRIHEAAKISAEKTDMAAYREAMSRELPLLDEQIRSLQEADVPKIWEQQHRDLFIVVQNIKRNLILLKDSEQDPLQALTAFSNLTQLIFEDALVSLGAFSQLMQQ